jgi:hypothetical protein
MESKICNDLKYDIYKIFDTLWFINIDGDQNIEKKKGFHLKTRFFLSLVIYFKEFGPCDMCSWV